MIREAIGKVWKLLPKAARRRIVRSTQTNFTVSVAAIVVNEKREILWLNHVLRPYSGWGFPGGFLDANERPADAIKREVNEETGIDLEDVRLHRVLVLEKHVEIIFFARPLGEASVRSSEIYELGWFGIHSLPEGTAVSQAILISEVLADLFDNPATEN
jgi:ADP-ribose pyrophosphatase YjhB (NUDIX family)